MIYLKNPLCLGMEESEYTGMRRSGRYAPETF